MQDECSQQDSRARGSGDAKREHRDQSAVRCRVVGGFRCRNAVWRWRQTRSDTLIEFLTPSFEEDEGLKKLPSLGVHAQSLHFLNYLIAEPIKAAVPYRSGVLVQIPRPERFAIHKLIVADRRRDGADSLKAHKDRRQAAFLIEALAEDRPEDLREAYEDARERGPRWRERLAATLKRMPETAKRLETL